MYQTILLLPLIGGLQSVNRKCGTIGGPILSIQCIVSTAIQSTIAFIEVGQNESAVSIKQGNWQESVYLNVEWTLIFDTLTVSMLIPVTYISALVQIYSMSYMSGDPHMPRFFSYLSLFSFFMQILITGDNFLVLFLGWEGVGQASYLLINFWFTRIAANMAAQKAFLINRVGDWGQSLGILLCIGMIGDQSFGTLFSLSSNMNVDIILCQVIFLIIGAAAKSAQIGLSAWLASAMEGPTPVSAQIHAATMVTAGVYLFMRCSPLQEYSTTGLMIITWLGGLSAQLGASCGLQENDQKKIIAFSTTSQLGYMVVAVGQSQYSIALFHLINHAFFKALQFLAAGSVIHAVSDMQDIRKMGGLVQLLPQTYSVILLGSLSLMAFPFMTGFYSKDFLLELAQIPKNVTSTMAYIQALMAAVLTATYSARLIILTFISEPHFPRTMIHTIMEPSLLMSIPLGLLALGSAFFGYLTHELFLGIGNTFYQQALFTHPNHTALQDAPFAPASILKYLPPMTLQILLTLFPQISTNTNTNTNTIKINKTSNIIDPLRSTGFLNFFNIFNHWIMFSVLRYAVILHRYFDKGLVELIGPMGLVRFFHYQAFQLEELATGFIPHYAYIIITTPIIVLITILFIGNIAFPLIFLLLLLSFI